MSQIDLFILAAEPSGDLQGSKLIEELLEIDPTLHICAVSGPLMRKLPIQTLFPMENLQVMGFIDVFFALPKIIRQFFQIRKTILTLNPKAVVFIDYPGFNLRLQHSLRKKGFQGKLVHYICPSVWAWGKKRIPRMEKNLDLLLTLFPFEKNCFSKGKLQVEHVGHPLTSIISQTTMERKNILAIFPGSRTSEISQNLPMQILVAKHLKTLDPTIDIAISISGLDKEKQIREIIKNFPCRLVEPGDQYQLMKSAKLAIATSGTVTLELALHETPTIVNYKIRPLDQFLAQKIFSINLPYYCIVNIIANKEIFPELFGSQLTENALLAKAEEFWNTKEKRTFCQAQCKEVRHLLGEKNASKEAGKKIFDQLPLHKFS